jgi:hypothetical protein
VKVSLRVEVRRESGAEPRVATLECDPAPVATGFIGDAAAACAAVREHRSVLAPPPAGRICTMIYGGPQEARITGSIDGQEVDRTVRRNDGCGVADWKALQALLGAPEEAPPQ